MRIMANVYALRGMIPVIDPTAFVHPTATLIGDVIVGPGVYVGPGASLRGDFGRLILEAGSNLQDNCIMHGLSDFDTVIEVDGHVGHGAIVHGARIGRNVLVGVNAAVMDYAEIGEDSVVAAMAFVKAKTIVPPRTMVAGIPAKPIRELTAKDRAWKAWGTREYQRLAEVCRESLVAAEPLTAVEADRVRDYVCIGEPELPAG
jgi:phenylacetic acid degradation protein